MKTFKPISKTNWKQSFKKWSRVNKVLASTPPDQESFRRALSGDCGYCLQYFEKYEDTEIECSNCPLHIRKVCVTDPYENGSSPSTRPF